MKIEVYAINLISQTANNFYVHVELCEPDEPGGEAFGLRIQETTDESLHDKLMGNLLYVARYDEAHIISVLQKFIDNLVPASWDDFKNRIPKELRRGWV